MGRQIQVGSMQLVRQRGRFAAAALLAVAISWPSFAEDANDGILKAPQAFRAAMAAVEPCLVRIEGFGGVTAAAGGRYPSPGEGPTTGVIVSADGHIVTSTFNFLKQPPVITVVLADGRRHVARLLGRDESRKICLLKVDGAADLPVPRLAPRGELRVGQWAVAAGRGSNAGRPTISAGIISATNRISGKAVQTDANTNPANYGGPLVDLDGRVIGICAPLSPGVQTEAAGSEWYDSGIGFAVPLDGLEAVLDRLKAGEVLKHPFLGLQAEPFGHPPSGAEVKTVVAQSPAAKAGLAAGDRIVALGSVEILDAAHLQSVLHRHLAGDDVMISFVRGGEKKSVTATLTAPPSPLASASGDSIRLSPK
jgi:serine protease Do